MQWTLLSRSISHKQQLAVYVKYFYTTAVIYVSIIISLAYHIMHV